VRWKARRRAAIACGLVGIVFTGFSARLIDLQVTRHEEYTALAAQKHSIRLAVPAHRGMILDRNGEILAANIPVRKVVVDGSHVKKPEALADLAAPVLGIPKETLVRNSKHAANTKSCSPISRKRRHSPCSEPRKKNRCAASIFTRIPRALIQADRC
jgi:cell division protein FtsI/penicillin-binding protein 2